MEIYKKFNEEIEVSNYGNVKNFNGGVVKTRIAKGGYHSFKYKNKEFFIHKVVLQLFNPVENMENKLIKRYDNDLNNNRLDNLYWKDRKKIVRNKKILIEYIPKENEIFKFIKSSENILEISNLGNVRRTGSNILLKGVTTLNSQGKKINTKIKNKDVYFNVAKEVLIAFVGEDLDKKYVWFKDGNPQNCKLENLEWSCSRFVFFFKIERNDINEIWKPCQWLKNLYEVSNKGNIRHIGNNKIRTLKTKKYGYKSVNLVLDGVKKSLNVHRIVLSTFNPIEGWENLEVNHINHNPSDNKLENLEWVTKSENMQKTKRSLKRKEMERLGIKKQKDGTFKINLKLHNFETKEEAFEFLTNAKKILNIN